MVSNTVYTVVSPPWLEILPVSWGQVGDNNGSQDIIAGFVILSRGVTGKAFGLVISRSQVQILLEATLRNNLRQVVYTYVPLSPSSITWYRLKGGDALRPGR